LREGACEASDFTRTCVCTGGIGIDWDGCSGSHGIPFPAFFPQRPCLYYLCMHPPCFYRYTLPFLPVWILWKRRGQADSGKYPNLNSCHVLLLQHIWIGGIKRLKCVGSKKTGRFLALFPSSVIGSTQMVKWGKIKYKYKNGVPGIVEFLGVFTRGLGNN